MNVREFVMKKTPIKPCSEEIQLGSVDETLTIIQELHFMSNLSGTHLINQQYNFSNKIIYCGPQ